MNRTVYMIAGLGLLTLMVLANVSSVNSLSPAESAQPNIIFIRTDDQDLQTFFDKLPNGRPVMKNVRDLILRRGTYFDRSYVSFPLCCPSRATTLTGQYAHNHTVLSNASPNGGYAKLNHTNTLPIWLNQAGYYTIHLGKYMNGYNVVLSASGNYPSPPPGWDDWFTTFGSMHQYYNYTVYDGTDVLAFGTDSSEYQTDVLTRKAQSYIIQRPYGNQPFFMQLDYLAPHEDLSTGNNPPPAAPRHQGLMSGAPLPMSPAFNEADVSDKAILISHLPPLNVQQINAVKDNYYHRMESLLAVDEGVGKILKTLRATGQYDNTIIVFTSDNGYMLGEHRKSGKFLPYEPLRVPLLMSGPGIPQGKIIPELVMNTDLTPTFLEWANATPGLQQDGRSLVPLLTNPTGTVAWRSDILTENPLVSHYRGLVTFDVSTGREYLYTEWDYTNDNVIDERELFVLSPDFCRPVGDPYLLESQHANPCYSSLLQQFHNRVAYLKTCIGSTCT